MAITHLIPSLIAAAAVTASTLVAAPAPAAAPAGTPARTAAGSPAGTPASEPGLVQLAGGRLRGDVADDHVTYSAIPYAAPPVEDLRWRPPEPARPWSGVRDATTPSTPCPQVGPDGIVGEEDCLFLDVTVPRNVRPGRRLPVLVWLYGGGFNSGGAHEFDGAELATAGEMIVVTPNYRLGALGFLSTPELDASGGNYGLMDQAAALRWVRRNASSFGGDPSNVTLAGQSAGARSVCAHLASPLSRGLFQRAIVQSGACANPVPDRAAAEAFARQAIEELGCSGDGDIAACLRRQPFDRLVTTLQGVGFEANARVADRPWNPVARTWMLPRQPGEALSDGSAARVPILIGAARDEMRGFVSNHADLTTDRYHAMLAETFGDAAEKVAAEYPVAGFGSPALALSAVLTDWGGAIGACPVLRTAHDAAAWQPVYAYEFAEDSGQEIEGYPLGAYHGLELPYLWDLNLAWDTYPELTAEQERLSGTMIGYWSAFVHSGDPNGSARPHWPAFTPGTNGTVIELSTSGIAPTAYGAEHKCGFWAGISS